MGLGDFYPIRNRHHRTHGEKRNRYHKALWSCCRNRQTEPWNKIKSSEINPWMYRYQINGNGDTSYQWEEMASLVDGAGGVLEGVNKRT